MDALVPHGLAWSFARFGVFERGFVSEGVRAGVGGLELRHTGVEIVARPLNKSVDETRLAELADVGERTGTDTRCR